MAKRSTLFWLAIAGGLIWIASRPDAPTVDKSPPDNTTRPLEKQERKAVAPLKAPTSPKPAFIKGSRVAFRGGPGKSYPVKDRFDVGRPIEVLEKSKDWSRVRDKLTQREGWVASFLIAESEPELKAVKPTSTPQKTISRSNALSDSAVVNLIIEQSLRSYPGSCPCPYNTDRAGRRCAVEYGGVAS